MKLIHEQTFATFSYNSFLRFDSFSLFFFFLRLFKFSTSLPDIIYVYMYIYTHKDGENELAKIRANKFGLPFRIVSLLAVGRILEDEWRRPRWSGA